MKPLPGLPSRVRRPAVRAAGAVALACGLALVLPWPRPVAALLAPDEARIAPIQDPVVLDRDGRTLRHAIGSDGARGTWMPLDAHPRNLILAVIAAEDERFLTHRGVDPIAILRAIASDLAAWRIVSGASTITQQTVRRLHPAPRTLPVKIREAVQAMALEGLLTKRQIMEQYLNRMPMPGNLRGATAGAEMLLGTALGDLSLGQCALLAALPRSPALLGRHPVAGPVGGRVEARRRWILSRMERLGFIDGKSASEARDERPVIRPRTFPFLAPHLADRLLARAGLDRPVAPIRTTIDADLQHMAQTVLASHRSRLERRGAHQAACVIVDNATGETRAYVGSLAYGPRAHGYCDGASAVHSAGSTLKPFAYALALEHGMTLTEPVPDVRRVFRTPRGDYDPRNFDRRDHGPVSLRTALGSSLNEAAVEVARRVGARSIADLLVDLGLLHDRRKATDLGIGIVIGNVEVSPADLACAYAALARGGMYVPAREQALTGGCESLECWLHQERRGFTPAPYQGPRLEGPSRFSARNHPGPGGGAPWWRCGGEASTFRMETLGSALCGHAPGTRPAPPRIEWRVIQPDTAYLILDALGDPTARTLAFGNPLELDYPFPVALKTGTSTGYRDSWAVGMTSRETVVVWVGNFSGAPTAGLAGATGAAPILRDLLLAMHPALPPPPFARPPGIIAEDVCSDSGGLPAPECPLTTRGLFLARFPLPPTCRAHRAGDGPGTRLDPIYASWLSQRARRGLTGRYRLAGTQQEPAAGAPAGSAPGATDGAATGASDSGGAPGLEIVSPLAGDRFILPPPAAATAAGAVAGTPAPSQAGPVRRDTPREDVPGITVRAQVRRLVPYLLWFVDGAQVARTPPPYDWRWSLARGRHRIVATTPDLAAASMVEISVE